MSHTFRIDNVEQQPMDGAEPVQLRDVLAEHMKVVIEDATETTVLRPICHPLADAVRRAWDCHRPLILTPDAIWLTIVQGLAKHIGQHSEQLRSRFVDFDGKRELRVRRDEFHRGAKNDWPGVFSEFSDQLAGFIGKKRDLLVSNFSTTGVVERAASEIALLDSMQSYFRYTLQTMCGIPKVTLTGDAADWSSIESRVYALGELDDLEWWLIPLLDVCGHFCQAARGFPDLDFWRCIYTEKAESGQLSVNGWINVFYPYLHGKKNEFMDPRRKRRQWYDGASFGDFAYEIPSAPFVWEFMGKSIPMRFVGGLVGTKERAGGALEPIAGWAIVEEKE